MKKELYEFIQEDGHKTNMLFVDYGTHVSVKDIGNNDIDYIFGKTMLVTGKPSTIQDELQYCIKKIYTYAPKVIKYKLLKTERK